MQEKLGNPETQASIEGSKLHETVATSKDTFQEHHQIVPVLIIIAAIIIGYLWLFG